MSDLIDRQAAIDICNNAIDLWHGQLGEGIVIAVKKKIEELPSAQPETQWIPVTKRLPNREEYIRCNGLFIVSDGDRTYAEYFDIYDKKCFGEPVMIILISMIIFFIFLLYCALVVASNDDDANGRG